MLRRAAEITEAKNKLAAAAAAVAADAAPSTSGQTQPTGSAPTLPTLAHSIISSGYQCMVASPVQYCSCTTVGRLSVAAAHHDGQMHLGACI